MSITETLSELGCKYKDMGNYINANAAWRNGHDVHSVVIYKDSLLTIDYVTGEKFHFKDLIGKILGDETKAKDLVDRLTIIHQEKPLIKIIKKLDSSFIKNLKKDYGYWTNRGISEETLKLFGGGVCLEGKMKNRYCFPIFDSKNSLLGVSGRDITGRNPRKWKHLGVKADWKFPLHINYKHIQESKEIFLVESVGCSLSLFDAGVKSSLVLFGTSLPPQIITLLLKLDLDRIYISLNQEDETSGIGNDAAKKIYKSLSNYFDRDRIVVRLPTKKDFNLMNSTEIKEWYDKIKSN